jgi:hypothetical protein
MGYFCRLPAAVMQNGDHIDAEMDSGGLDQVGLFTRLNYRPNILGADL